jgi:pimeloyl-ACP methyl ester carboxylesterase
MWHKTPLEEQKHLKATFEWLESCCAGFGAADGRVGYAHLRNYTAEYREWGQGAPLILVPGLAGGVELLGPIARLLASHYRVISYQLRGEDDCFALRRPFGIFDLVEDLSEFMEWHCLERPAIFGISFGGILALEFAANYPHRLRALAVQGVGSRFERGLIQEIAGVVLSRYPLPADNPFINQFFNVLFGGAQKPGPLFDFVTRQCWQTDQGVMAHRFHLVEQFDVASRLPRIRVPSLVLTGERDLLVSRDNLDNLCSGIPQNRRVSLPDCGHLAFLTQPQRVAREIERFLD